MWPSIWFTPTNGFWIAYANPFAYDTPTSKAPTNPGPYVQLTTSISSNFIFACFRASFTTWLITSTWHLEAISGTTPPYKVCISICEFITFDKTFLPFTTTAAEVSSQLVSIPNNYYIFHNFPFITYTYFINILLICQYIKLNPTPFWGEVAS